MQNFKLLAVQEPGFLKSKFGQNQPLNRVLNVLYRKSPLFRQLA